MPILLQLQNVPWKGDGWRKKSVFAPFFAGGGGGGGGADQKIASSYPKNAFWGIL